MVKFVVPGELISEQVQKIPHTYVENGKLYASVMGMLDEKSTRIVPLQGPYMPIVQDNIIGVVKDVKFAGYNVDLNTPASGFLSNKDCREELKLGDVIFAKVKDVDEMKSINLMDAVNLVGGEVLMISPVKIPRVIGKRDSMITMIANATGSEVYIGNNGTIWIKGGNSSLTSRAILKIEREAHTSGLTDRIREFLENESKNNI
ncbi:MAG: exosome complex protein Rrp4 [Candidatus Micrarchaeota archaeon]